MFRVYLVAPGAMRTLAKAGIRLREGATLKLHMSDTDIDGNPEELVVTGRAHFDEWLGHWVALIDNYREEVKHVSELVERPDHWALKVDWEAYSAQELADVRAMRGHFYLDADGFMREDTTPPPPEVEPSKAERRWRDLQGRVAAGDLVEAEVVGPYASGLLVEVQGVRAVLSRGDIRSVPRSGRVPMIERLRAMRGQRLVVKVIRINSERRRLTLSEHADPQLWEGA